MLEELATKGALGTLSYGAMWAVLVWAIVRRRREPRDEVLTYTILGALAGYFAQNLFLFDTPAMLLQWALLVSWVVSQEKAPVLKRGELPIGDNRARAPPPSSQKPRSPVMQALTTSTARGQWSLWWYCSCGCRYIPWAIALTMRPGCSSRHPTRVGR